LNLKCDIPVSNFAFFLNSSCAAYVAARVGLFSPGGPLAQQLAMNSTVVGLYSRLESS
jgi:hypothetical protein